MTTEKDTIAAPELLPCPFCGGVDIHVYDNCVICHHCSASGPDLGHCIGPRCRADAIAAWSQRALMTTDKDATIVRLTAENEAAEQEHTRLRYVLEGVRAAIDTGRNEPLLIWRDQINIVLGD